MTWPSLIIAILIGLAGAELLYLAVRQSLRTRKQAAALAARLDSVLYDLDSTAYDDRHGAPEEAL